MVSLRSLLLLFDDAESNSISESLSFCSCDVELVQLSLGEHLAESSSISKLSSSSNGLLYFWRADEFVVRLQFSSESTLRRPYAFRGGRCLFLSVIMKSKKKKNYSICNKKHEICSFFSISRNVKTRQCRRKKTVSIKKIQGVFTSQQIQEMDTFYFISIEMQERKAHSISHFVFFSFEKKIFIIALVTKSPKEREKVICSRTDQSMEKLHISVAAMSAKNMQHSTRHSQRIYCAIVSLNQSIRYSNIIIYHAGHVLIQSAIHIIYVPPNEASTHKIIIDASTPNGATLAVLGIMKNKSNSE